MASRDVKFFEQHFLFSNRLVQIILRLRSNQNSNNQYLPLFLIFGYFIPMVVNLICELLTKNLSMEDIVVEVRKIFTGILVACIYVSIYINNLTMRLIFSRISQDLELLSSQEELRIIEKYNKENKLYIWIIVVLLSFYIILITSSCFLKILLYFFGKLDINQLTLPLGFYEISNAGILYFCLLIYQTIGFYMLLTIGIVCLASYVVIVQHACCQFSIIIWKIQRSFKSDSEYFIRTTMDQKIKSLIEFNWIVDIIVSYRKLSEYVNLINCFSQLPYLIAVFISMLVVVVDFICILQLPIVLENLPKLMEFCGFITGSIFTIYINFYIGQKLLNFSETVFKELCQIPFYLLSKTTQFLLLFLIRRALKPCMLSIGGLYVSSHESFSGLIQKAFSFAMVYSSIK